MLELEDELNEVIIKFILKLNHLYHSHVFTSARIANEIIKVKNIKKTYFPKVHKIVKNILDDWHHKGICSFINKTKLGRSRKTKVIYQFSESGINQLKKELITAALNTIKKRKRGAFISFINRKHIIEKYHRFHRQLLL
ncbi:MAG: hypothetical protein ACTSYR_03300 [Candidatus Odinarchaeia archaeon]